jgi:hypothetical protein
VSFSSEEESSFIREEFIYNLQKSVKKRIPKELRNTILNYFSLKDKIYPTMIQNSVFYEKLPSKLKKALNEKIYERFNVNYSIFFRNCNNDFVNNIYSNLKTNMSSYLI